MKYHKAIITCEKDGCEIFTATVTEPHPTEDTLLIKDTVEKIARTLIAIFKEGLSFEIIIEKDDQYIDSEEYTSSDLLAWED